MRLKVMQPTQVVVDEPVRKVKANGQAGAFTLLPRHIDYLSILEPGIMTYENESGEEIFLAVDEGLLVKRGEQVLVSTRTAIPGPELAELEQTVAEQFFTLAEDERKMRSALAGLEANLVQRMLDFSKDQ